MVCESISSIECSVLLASQQDVKLLFLLMYSIIFIFIWYYFTPKRIDKIKTTYFAMPLLTAKWSGAMYFILAPIHVLLFVSNTNFDIVLGWFALFYLPTIIVTAFMPFLWIMDRLFMLFGYKNTFDFAKKYRGGTI